MNLYHLADGRTGVKRQGGCASWRLKLDGGARKPECEDLGAASRRQKANSRNLPSVIRRQVRTASKSQYGEIQGSSPPHSDDLHWQGASTFLLSEEQEQLETDVELTFEDHGGVRTSKGNPRSRGMR